jgi:CDP-paratose 2-epimerase
MKIDGFSFKSIKETKGEEKNNAILITGGAGFIGTNLANQLMLQGETVIIFDNLSRPGSEENLRWLIETHKERLKICINDIRNFDAIREAVSCVKTVYHFAAQVAVTSSVVDPMHDFDVNVRGTINVLEAIRKADNPPPLIVTSTNKVYGCLSDLPLCKTNKKYTITEKKYTNGFDELTPLNFQSPYGCSKGAADQYVLDYSRTYGLKAVVFRMSCIYGPHQYGNEDQGWVAHFIFNTFEESDIVIYGDGFQVRDILHINDLLEALICGWNKIDVLTGNAFNIGGGPANQISLLELMEIVELLYGKKSVTRFAPWRSGDQKYYVSDFSKFKYHTGWNPKMDIQSGLENTYEWILHNRIKLNHFHIKKQVA